MATTAPFVYLSAHGLCSKWGFSDGDCPEHLLDYWDEIGVDYNAIEWHPVLRKLVRDHLVPAMTTVGHAVEVYDIETIHNPIRARTIDGVEIDDYADMPAWVKPVEVNVPYEAVARACGL